MIIESLFQNLWTVIVDDDYLIRIEMKAIPEEDGLLTLDASDGEKAIALFVQQRAVIFLLFTDVQLPGKMTGFAIAHETARRWPHIAIVVAAGQRQPGPGDMPDGASFIPKPFMPTTVHKQFDRTSVNKIQP